MTHTTLFSALVRKVLLVLSMLVLVSTLFLGQINFGGQSSGLSLSVLVANAGVCDAVWPSSTTWSIISNGVLGTLTLNNDPSVLSTIFLNGAMNILSNVVQTSEGLSFSYKLGFSATYTYTGTFGSDGLLSGTVVHSIFTTLVSTANWSASTGTNICTTAPAGGSCVTTWPAVSSWTINANGSTGTIKLNNNGTGEAYFNVLGVTEILTNVVLSGSSVSFTRPGLSLSIPRYAVGVGSPAAPQYYIGLFDSQSAISGTFTHPYFSSTSYSWSSTKTSGTVTCEPTTQPEPTATFSASPTAITGSGNTTLSWSSTNANSCTGSGFNTGNSTSGSVSTAISVSTTYTLSCTGGGGGVSKTATVIVTQAPNINPTCSAGGDITINTGKSATFSCSATDPDGIIVSYSWTFGDGTSSGTQNPTHVYSSAGVYTATCTATDDRGGTDTDTTIVTVTDPKLGSDLIANAPVINGTLEEGNNITFTGITTNQGDTSVVATFDNRFQIDVNNNGTYDINIDALNSITNLNNGSSKSVISPTWSNIPAGTHAVRYCADLPGGDVVESNEGNNCSGKFVFVVSTGANQLPQVNAGDDKITDSGDPTSFSCSATDPDGTIVSYSWTFGDGTGDVGANVTHTYSSSGTYTAICTATDNDGGSGTDTVNTTVSALLPPTVTFGASSDTIVGGSGTDIIWSSTNTTSCTSSDFPTGGATSGSSTVLPTTDTTYSINCTGPGGSVTKNTTVFVNWPTPDLSLSANPSVVPSGQNTTLAWSASNVSSCTITGPVGQIVNVTSPPFGGSKSVGPITKVQTYTLTCTPLDGSSSPSASVTVRVLPSTFEEF